MLASINKADWHTVLWGCIHCTGARMRTPCPLACHVIHQESQSDQEGALSSAHQMSQATSVCPGASWPSLLLLWVPFPFFHRRPIPTFSRSPPSRFSAPSFFSLSPPPYYKNSFLLHQSGQFQNVFVRHSQTINTQRRCWQVKKRKELFWPTAAEVLVHRCLTL